MSCNGGWPAGLNEGTVHTGCHNLTATGFFSASRLMAASSPALTHRSRPFSPCPWCGGVPTAGRTGADVRLCRSPRLAVLSRRHPGWSQPIPSGHGGYTSLRSYGPWGHHSPGPPWRCGKAIPTPESGVVHPSGSHPAILGSPTPFLPGSLAQGSGRQTYVVVYKAWRSVPSQVGQKPIPV
jgi:hypothetical protein